MNGPMNGPDPELAAFLADVGGAVEADIHEDPGFPDFAAVVARAHELDPSRVPEQAVAEVADYAPVVPLAAQRRRRSTRDDVALAAFVAEVRAAVDVEVAESFRVAGLASHASQPGHASPASPASHTSQATRAVPAAANDGASSRRMWATVLALAAAVVLVAGGVLSAVQLSEGDAGVDRPEAALHGERASAGEQEAVIVDEQPEPKRRGHEDEGEDEGEDEAPVPDEVEDVEIELDAEIPADTQPKQRRRPKADPKPSLEEVDAAARAAWRGGDRAEARRLYGEVVRRGGKRNLAEMAYGDLMAIARQTGARGEEAKLWRAYLAKFPKGAFADDARAGLCRRASDGAAQTCWTRYLADFPSGSHTKAAKDRLAEADAP